MALNLERIGELKRPVMRRRLYFLIIVVSLSPSLAFSQGNGKLQLHFMDVGQGDAAVLISPRGEVVLFDNGVQGECDQLISYLQQLGISKINYNIVSHYHSDHIGCTPGILARFPLMKEGIDRGGSYPSGTFRNYVKAVGGHRKTAVTGMKVNLDVDSASPVEIEMVALNGDGFPTTNENDLSLVAVVHYGEFNAEVGGDLSGYDTRTYDDVESSVARRVGHIDVYKVHHHCSQYSSNSTWLSTVKPTIAIVSVGNGNTYHHPTVNCIERLHKAGVKTYWTELGSGATPQPGMDIVGGNIIIEVAGGGQTFEVTHKPNQLNSPKAGTQSVNKTLATFAWSKRSIVYHYSDCEYVRKISPANLQRGDSPPTGKKLHLGCPK
ncbi:MAG: MBL fold metallo-hydrolase [Acidobacteriia bacterium]|nr:MBL fold metallo-hydrolase [Terriglobia bacterium]